MAREKLKFRILHHVTLEARRPDYLSPGSVIIHKMASSFRSARPSPCRNDIDAAILEGGKVHCNGVGSPAPATSMPAITFRSCSPECPNKPRRACYGCGAAELSRRRLGGALPDSGTTRFHAGHFWRGRRPPLSGLISAIFLDRTIKRPISSLFPPPLDTLRAWNFQRI
jgi:hypothetical protein